MKNHFSKFIGVLFVAILTATIISCGSGTAQETTGNNTPPPKSMINQSPEKEKSVNTPAPGNTSTPTSSSIPAEDSNPPSTSPPMTEKQMEGARNMLSSVSEKDVAAIDGKFIFKIHCAVCHGFKGNAKVNGATDLTKSKISLTESVAQINYGRGLMTPYYVLLSKEEVVAVARYSETLR